MVLEVDDGLLCLFEVRNELGIVLHLEDLSAFPYGTAARQQIPNLAVLGHGPELVTGGLTVYEILPETDIEFPVLGVRNGKDGLPDQFLFGISGYFFDFLVQPGYIPILVGRDD